MSEKKRTLKIVLPILILLVGIGVALLLVKSRQLPKQEEKTFAGPLVEVMEVAVADRQVTVFGTGTVQSRREVEITPQVGGKVVKLSPRLVSGGFFRQGEELLTVEQVDYRLALDLAQAGLAQAELQLEQTRSQAEIARSEWQRLADQAPRPATPLTLYEPQLKAATAQLAAARSALEQARLNLERTVIRAPFNCYVRSEKVDLGQVLRPGSPVATVAGSDAVEIVVPLPLEELKWLQIPEQGKDSGSPATVRVDLGHERHNWQGQIVRSEGEIDPRSRMARVVVAVTDPYGRASGAGDSGLALKPGMFAEVEFHGALLTGVMAIPRGALRDGETVWLEKDNLLEIRPVEIARRERERVLIETGVAPGDRVVLTGLSAAAEGMKLRPQLRED